MAKGKKSVFFCQNCGYESPKWLGQCPGCREWNTFVEETISSNAGRLTQGISSVKTKPVLLSEIEINEDNRVCTGMADRHLSALHRAQCDEKAPDGRDHPSGTGVPLL